MNGLTNGLTTTTTTRPSQPLPAPEIRTRERANIEEEAGPVLRLGDFQHAPCLSMSEARIIVEAIFDSRKKAGKKPPATEALSKMQEHMDTYARFKTRGTTSEVEHLLVQYNQLEPFERAQLATLCPGDIEEAKTLIPSLEGKIEDETLQDLLGQINSYRSRVFVD